MAPSKKSKPKAAPKTSVKKAAPAKKASAKVSSKSSAKTPAPKKAAAKKETPKKAASVQAEEIIEKKTSKGPEKSAADKRRSALSAAMQETTEEERDSEKESEEEDEFDPEAFFAASGGKGLFRAHVMRKERVDLSIPVRYRFLTGPLVFNAELVNLSKGGLCLKTPKEIKQKTVIKIEIPLPHTSELFTVQAEVVWCDALTELKGDDGSFFAGLKFLAMSLAKQTVINNFIQQRRDEIVLAKIGLDKFTDSVPVAGLD